MSVRMQYLSYALYSDDITLSRVNVNIISQATMHLSIILATLPCAKPLFIVFEAGVFKKPHGPQEATQKPADETQDTRDGTTCSAPPCSWDRRTGFAKKSSTPVIQQRAPPKKHVSIRLMPLSWNRRQTFASRDTISVPPSAFRSRSRRPSSASKYGLWTSSSSSSLSGMRTSLPRHYAVALRPPPHNREQSHDTHASSSTSHMSRRQSEYDDWLEVLRPDDTRTVTTIHHDPVDAAQAARRRSLEFEEEEREFVIEQTTEVQVSYEEAGPSEDWIIHERGPKQST